MPTFEIRLRNRGTSAITFVSEALSSAPEIEIDGIWYRSAGGGSCCTNPQTVAPGADSNPLRVTIENKLMFEFNSNQQLKLMSGKHSIRIRNYSTDRINITAQGATPHRIVLISNRIDFEVAG
jgi:hypothetical protein